MIIVPDDPGADSPLEYLKASVTRVFDGDGFMADVWNPMRNAWVSGIPFRFAFIDAPEMGQPAGEDARDFLAALILGKTLRLDPIGKESSGYLPVDSYKRLLCMGYLTQQMEAGPVAYYLNGECYTGTARRPRPVARNIELEMLVNGWAWKLEQYAFEREEEYAAAQQDARRNRRGIWASDNPEPPWLFKRRQRQDKRRCLGQGRLI